MIVNRRYHVELSSDRRPGAVIAAIEAVFEEPPLRWFISQAEPRRLTVEATEVRGAFAPAVPEPEPVPAGGPAVVVSLIPTGIGCEIGGFAGDAAPVTVLLSRAADYVVTNPNAVNASDFVVTDERILYTEGRCIDLFAAGAVNLYRARGNRIGVIIDAADAGAVDHVFNLVNAARAIHGVDIAGCIVTDGPVGTRCVRMPSGAYVGDVAHPERLLAAAQQLVDAGADALAVTTNIGGLDAGDYADHFRGDHPNPVGGAEAILSHLLVNRFHLPVAHAPMVNFKCATGVVDARAAGEHVSPSGLACVLIGLRDAPQIRRRPGRALGPAIGVANVVAVVAPAGALGGAPILHALHRGIPVIGVRENACLFDVSAQRLGLTGVIEVANYVEAAGTILALRSGIGLASLRRPLPALRPRENAARENAALENAALENAAHVA
jgi:hypothetical protein